MQRPSLPALPPSDETACIRDPDRVRRAVYAYVSQSVRIELDDQESVGGRSAELHAYIARSSEQASIFAISSDRPTKLETLPTGAQLLPGIWRGGRTTAAPSVPPSVLDLAIPRGGR